MSNFISPILTPVLTGVMGQTIGTNASYSFSVEALALFARMTTQPTTTRAILIDTCIRSLISAGVWATLDALWFMAAADAQAAQLNWISNSYTLNPINSPTFTVDRGYTGDGARAYLATGANGGSLAHFSQNSANLFAWQLNNVQSAWAVGDTGLTNFNQPRTSGDKAWVRINDGGISTAAINVAITDARGLTSANRDSASSRQLYKNGILIGQDTQASVAPSTNFQILGVTGGFTLGQEAVVGIGSSLNSTQEAAKYAALNTYLAGVGAV